MARPKGAKDSKKMAQEAHIAQLAKAYAPSALKVLNDISKSGESEAARVSAANAILDRAYGKPVQAVNHGDADGSKLPTTYTMYVNGVAKK